MSEKCEHCHQELSDVRFRDGKELPENMADGYYCQECVNNMKKKWWENEKKAYIYDNSGNRADEPGYDPDDD